MHTSGALWEVLLRFCLLLYDQISKLEAPETALTAGFPPAVWMEKKNLLSDLL